jgi:hypothetical protein
LFLSAKKDTNSLHQSNLTNALKATAAQKGSIPFLQPPTATSMLATTLRSGFTRPLHVFASPARALATAHPGEQALVQEGKVVARTKAESKTVEVRQQHLSVSPKKLKLTTSLVRASFAD